MRGHLFQAPVPTESGPAITRRGVALMFASTAALAGLPAGIVQAAGRASRLPGRTTWIEANGATLRYELSGTGSRTIVLLHELSTSLESWDDIAPDLARNNRVLRYDLRGYGLSQRVTGDMTMRDEIEDLHALLAALGIHGPITLVGGAVGAAIALAFAAAYPDRVDGVVAISPAAYLVPRNMQTPLPPSASTPASPPLMAGPVPQQDASYPKEIQARHPERYKRFKAISGTSGSPGMSAGRAAYAVAFADVMPKIRCPVLVVANTPWMRTVESFKELAAAAPKGEVVVVNTAHFATIAAPELLLPILQTFLRKTAK